jgi:hypothetical protein
MSMNMEEILRSAIVTAEANEGFTEAVMRLRDKSRLCFCHRVGERWVKAVGPDQREANAGLAGELLSAMTMFRLNAKHWISNSKTVADGMKLSIGNGRCRQNLPFVRPARRVACLWWRRTLH